jgi:hypothetical protein
MRDSDLSSRAWILLIRFCVQICGGKSWLVVGVGRWSHATWQASRVLDMLHVCASLP